jgi:hypothetical protein
VSADEFARVYEKAAWDAYAKGAAVVAAAVEKAEARRRFHVDSQGCAVITYADSGEEEE